MKNNVIKIIDKINEFCTKYDWNKSEKQVKYIIPQPTRVCTTIINQSKYGRFQKILAIDKTNKTLTLNVDGLVYGTYPYLESIIKKSGAIVLVDYYVERTSGAQP